MQFGVQCLGRSEVRRGEPFRERVIQPSQHFTGGFAPMASVEARERDGRSKFPGLAPLRLGDLERTKKVLLHQLGGSSLASRQFAFEAVQLGLMATVATRLDNA